MIFINSNLFEISLLNLQTNCRVLNMDKREFIKTGVLGIAGLAAVPAIARNSFGTARSLVNIPQLPYKFNSFSTFLSEKNLQKHYSLYIDAAEELKADLSLSLNKISKVRDIFLCPDRFDNSTIKTAGTYFNHKIFFKTLTPKGSEIQNASLNKAIIDDFGSFENFRNQFENAALNLNTHGWVWLTYKNNRLFISATKEDENPFLKSLPKESRGFPVLGLDVWKHAYSFDYGNKSEGYIKNFLYFVDWKFIERRYNRALKTIV